MSLSGAPMARSAYRPTVSRVRPKVRDFAPRRLQFLTIRAFHRRTADYNTPTSAVRPRTADLLSTRIVDDAAGPPNGSDAPPPH